MTRADMGDYMRELREHFGLSQHDVSERLNIRVKYIVAMEAGQFDTLPGKVYARGYVHTYAEFLGLNADQVVERCFGPELVREQQAHMAPLHTRPLPKSQVPMPLPRGWVAMSVVIVLFLMMYLAIGGDEGEQMDTVAIGAVESVPESLLVSMRVMVMPNTATRDCWRGAPLGCFHAQNLTRDYVLPAGEISHGLGMIAKAEEEEAPVAKEVPKVEEEAVAPAKKETPKPAAPAKKQEEAPKAAEEPQLPENYMPSPSTTDEAPKAEEEGGITIEEELSPEDAKQIDGADAPTEEEAPKSAEEANKMDEQ